MVDKWISPEGLMLIECWARDGLSKAEVATKIGVSQKTFWEWRKYHEELEEALSKGREVIDYEVENALKKIALGCEKRVMKTTTTNIPDENGNFFCKTEMTVETVLPNATACMAWLNNRNPDKWKRNRDLVSIEDSSDDTITINVVKKASPYKANADGNEAINDTKQLKTSKKGKNKGNSGDLDENGWPIDWED